MLDAQDTATLEMPHSAGVLHDDAVAAGDQAVLVSRSVLERLQTELKFKQTKIEALTFELARLKQWRFGSSSESLDSSTQAVLFDAIVADTRTEDAAQSEERERLAALGAASAPAPTPQPRRAVRSALPAELPRIDHHHVQAAALPAQIIDKGIPAPGLLAQVVIAKHDDHLPLYRQEEIYAR